MGKKYFFIVLIVCVLSYCNAVRAECLSIIFPVGGNLEVDQEFLPVIGTYNGNEKELKLTLNNSSISTFKLEKGNIFTDKIKLNSGLNEVKIVNGKETQIIKVYYAKDSKNIQQNFKKLFLHTPVLEDECSECHNKEAKGNYPSVDSSKVICFDCHDSFEKDKFVHGPIGSGSCTACHDPHGSKEVNFLREDKNKICYMCHEEESIKTGHLANLKNSNKEECSYCHNSHGGKDKFFLKDTK